MTHRFSSSDWTDYHATLLEGELELSASFEGCDGLTLISLTRPDQARKIVSNRPHPGTPHSGGAGQRFLIEVEKLGDHLSERIKGSRAYVDLSREHTWMTR